MCQRRFYTRKRDISEFQFEKASMKEAPQHVFFSSMGYQSLSLNGGLRLPMRNSGLQKNGVVLISEPPYSLRHTYATQVFICNEVDSDVLVKKIGNLADVIEPHYSNLTANLLAARLA